MNRMIRTLLISGASLALPLAARATTPAPPQHSTPAQSQKPAKERSSHTTRWVDLNGGTREQLMQLSGVTATVADAIIAGRPYNTKSQLLDRKIVDAKEYKRIARYLSVKAAPKAGGQK